MANGRAASLEAHEALAGEDYLAIGEIAGRAGGGAHTDRRGARPEEIERSQGAAIPRRTN